MIPRKRRSEKFVEWVNIPIPESYYKVILDFLNKSKKFTSPSEYIRHAIREQLIRDHKGEK